MGDDETRMRVRAVLLLTRGEPHPVGCVARCAVSSAGHLATTSAGHGVAVRCARWPAAGAGGAMSAGSSQTWRRPSTESEGVARRLAQAKRLNWHRTLILG